MSFYQRHVFVCTNLKDPQKKCCGRLGGEEAGVYLKEALVAKGCHGKGKIRVSRSGCLGRCGQGPCLVVYPQGRWYTYQSPQDLDEIIEKELMASTPVSRLLLPSE